ncbi:photosystem reaction center subunit H [Prochlorococcus marinus str. MU1402]|uniref:PRC-barrel domain-containing protein n=1 Tax=Prochlorococcus marinus TaxID=1219 RepID=UPI001ADD386B|nr:PRC-barrel domain-containing protein [Prochlorococcus marinus]MBO8231080.1 photosystem reaction center subunit H [Prochlorococcus marinus XMU1402]MBW3055844.1 photosystem reaction center subunit H [Prochlorococcus marinus str. MU1402]
MSLSNTSANKNRPNSIPSERLWLRSELMGTQVITTDTGRRLGVVGEVVVDIDRREVVALGLRDNPLTRFLPGLPKWMPLESIKQVGDVILVDSLDSLSESFSPERYGKVINCQVITESGQLLGRVLGFSFDIETGDLISLVMGAVGVPLLGEGVLSTWEIPVEEIVSSGTDRIIVYEGAEEKLNQLSSGLLEKLGVGGSSWDERDVNGYSANLVPVENQLLSGSESEQQNNLVEEYEEVSEQDDDYYEDELEYVEIKGSSEEINNRKKLYMDNDYSDQDQIQDNADPIVLENNVDFKQKKQSTTNLASKRPIQNATETLDIEPLDEQNIIQDNKKSEKFDIDDPW